MLPKKAKMEVAEEEEEAVEQADEGEQEMEDGDQEMDDGEQESQGEALLEKVVVEFEAWELAEKDRDMVMEFLKKAIPRVPPGDLCEVLLGERGVGSSIHMPCSEEEMVQAGGPGSALEELETSAAKEGLGFLSVLDMGRHWERVSVAQIADYLLTSCPALLRDRLDEILVVGTGPVGLLLNERHLHIPPQIAPPLFSTLMNEVEKSKMKLEHYILMAQTFRASGNPDEEPTFGKGEEECFYRHKDFSYDIEMRKATKEDGEKGEKDDVDSYRTVIVIPVHKMPDVMRDMKELWSA